MTRRLAPGYGDLDFHAPPGRRGHKPNQLPDKSGLTINNLVLMSKDQSLADIEGFSMLKFI